MMPYDFFMVLEKKGTSEPFRSNENMNGYRYLPQKTTSSNPDALPVGFVKDTYKGHDYIGLTCAACHTGQINYKGKGNTYRWRSRSGRYGNVYGGYLSRNKATLENERRPETVCGERPGAREL